MEIREARPTEWKGVVYRSKSEACMAHYLSTCGYRIEYEPEWLAVDGWIPDFAAVFFQSNSPGLERLSLKVIEYKPVNPTGTYRDELYEHFSQINERLQFLPHLFLELWVGSFFDSRTPKTRYRWGGDGELFVTDSDWPCSQLVERSARYRFDLEAR